jgi:Flp pilus assembly protein CpaB
MLQNKKLIQILVSAIMAILFFKFYLKQKEQAIEISYGMVEVLSAARDIPPHTQLSANYLTTQMVPLKYMQPGAFMVKIPEQARDRIKGKVTIAAIPEGSQIVQSNLADPSIKDTGVAPLIPPGKRGYLLRLGNTDVANLILPGDHIDVMATFTVRKQDGNTSKATYTILQNILVIGVGKELKKSNEAVTGKTEAVESLVLTMAVAPKEAEQLALAQAESQNEISIVVRPHGENDIRNLPGVSPGGILKQ